jgi:hypothetical protein
MVWFAVTIILIVRVRLCSTSVWRRKFPPVEAQRDDQDLSTVSKKL